MPTYSLVIPEHSLSDEQKTLLAQEITRLHCEATGAPLGFVQVIFQELARGNHFVGGAVTQQGQVFVRGEIRAGRAKDVKSRLVADIQRETSSISKLPQSNVWVYIHESPPSQMSQLGRILPEPGDESVWIAMLPPDVQARLRGR